MLKNSPKSRNSRIAALRDTHGVALIVAVGLTFMLVMLAAGTAKLVTSFVRTTFQVEQANVAYAAAEAGVELALYDLAAYLDGYQTDPNPDINSGKQVCNKDIDITTSSNFTGVCGGENQYRFANFTGQDEDSTDPHALSKGRGFWRLFARTLLTPDTNKYVIPNPYFVGDKNGELDTTEWGILTKSRPLSLSLLIDGGDLTKTDPAERFTYLLSGRYAKVILAAETNPDNGDDDELLTWTLSAIDGYGVEYTLQGVVRESDFVEQDCDDDGVDEFCFILDLNDDDATPGSEGHALAGEDINKNIDETVVPAVCPGSSDDCSGSDAFNRVSDVQEDFNYNTTEDFIDHLNDAMGDSTSDKHWRNVRLTVGLISTLSKTSGVKSNSLRYKMVSDELWADEYVYIISEGFAGLVKQTIETRFRRGSTIPIFSYVIFQ